MLIVKLNQFDAIFQPLTLFFKDSKHDPLNFFNFLISSHLILSIQPPIYVTFEYKLKEITSECRIYFSFY